MSSEVITKLDASFQNEKSKLKYPYIFIPKFGEELALVVTCLEPGSVPIVVMDEGVLKQIYTTSVSALNLAKLCKVYKFWIHIDRETKSEINNTLELMEVIPWML